jgi:hypothetical protein
MDYGINIGIGISGSSRLNAAVNQIERINAAVENLNANPLTLFKKGRGSATDEVASLNTAVMDLVRSFTNGERKLGGTFASVAAQAASFGDILEQVDGTFTNISSKAAKKSGLDQLAKLFGEATLQAEKFATAQEKIRQQGIAAAQSTAGPAGKFTVLGSPEAIQQQGIFEAKIAEQRKKNAKNDLMFQRLRLEVLTSQARILEDQVRSSSRIGRLAADSRVQSAAISGGFPLLFGGGPGAVLGGGIGGFFGDFAGGIAGSAIGQTFDQLVERANAIGNAIGALDFDTLEQSGVRVNAELQLQIEKLQELRQFKEAEALLSQEVNAQVGTLPGTIEDAANAGNLLGNAFQELLNSAGATLAIVGAPFAAALALILKTVNELFRVVNLVLSLVGTGIKKVGEFVLELVLGEEQVNRINEALANSSENLKNARLEAAEFRQELESTYAGLNEQVVALKNNLKFEQERQTGIDDQSKFENLALERRIALQAAFDKKIAESAKLRKQGLLTDEARNLIESRYQTERLLAEERYQNKVETFNANLARKQQAQAERDERAAKAKENRLQRMAVSIEKANKKTFELTEPLQKQLNAIKDKAAFEREYGQLIDQGVTPAVAKQTVEISKQKKEIDRLAEKQLREADLHILNLEILLEKAKGTRNEVAAQEALNRALERRNEIEKKAAEAKRGVEGEAKTPRQRIEEQIKTIRGELNQLTDPVNQVIAAANAIGDAFAESFRGIIDGSMTAREALANLFQRTADHFADMAAQMIAKQIQMQVLGIALNFFSAAAGPRLGGGAGPGGYRIPEAAAPKTSGIKFFNEGGYVSGPTRAVVGEGGESEYVIPESKMRESMARYSRGARGSSVIPEAGGSGTSGEGGGAAVAAPIDVRFTVERINSVDYVTADQFQSGMRQAANQGAKQGEQQTLKRLQMSSGTRKRLGM